MVKMSILKRVKIIKICYFIQFILFTLAYIVTAIGFGLSYFSVWLAVCLIITCGIGGVASFYRFLHPIEGLSEKHQQEYFEYMEGKK